MKHLIQTIFDRSEIIESYKYNEEECLIYKGVNRYHEIYDKTTKEKYGTHRLICAEYHGNPPTDKHQVNHLCCNPGCVNPNHLEWTTPQENIHYAYTHGNKKLKLSRADVIAIRKSTKKGVELAKIYKVTSAYISYIRNYKKRVHV